MAKIETLSIARRQKAAWDLDDVLEELRVSREITHNIRQGGHIRELPSPQTILDIIEGLCAALFPTHLGQAAVSRENTDFFVSNSLTTALSRLAEQVRRGLQFGAGASQPPELLRTRGQHIAQDFARQLPAIRAVLVSDLKAAYAADPSAGSIAEILLCYRSLTAIIYHRIAHALHLLGARLVARVISDLAHATTGIDIHPGARIGESFFIDHGAGIVIGESAVIGKNVRLSQAVTIGADLQPIAQTGEPPHHAVIGDNVVIQSGATIPGAITVGHGSVIGGNVWLTHSVPPGSSIAQAQSQIT